ncbi:hypothetical protein ACE6H2_021355 [Prunus campanulata]
MVKSKYEKDRIRKRVERLVVDGQWAQNQRTRTPRTGSQPLKARRSSCRCGRIATVSPRFTPKSDLINGSRFLRLFIFIFKH